MIKITAFESRMLCSTHPVGFSCIRFYSGTTPANDGMCLTMHIQFSDVLYG